MSAKAAGVRIPEVVGGILLECVGGPLDGEWVFLRHSDSTVDVGHFFDDRRTPWINGAHPGAANFLGWYSPSAFTNGATAHWRTTQTEGAHDER